MPMDARIADELSLLLKRFDRIGFGRNGVLDAEDQIAGWYSALPESEQAIARTQLLSWLSDGPANEEAGKLHYTTPDKVQALAITLCGVLPIPESWETLSLAAREGRFQGESECADRLADTLARLADDR